MRVGEAGSICVQQVCVQQLRVLATGGHGQRVLSQTLSWNLYADDADVPINGEGDGAVQDAVIEAVGLVHDGASAVELVARVGAHSVGGEGERRGGWWGADSRLPQHGARAVHHKAHLETSIHENAGMLTKCLETLNISNWNHY